MGIQQRALTSEAEFLQLPESVEKTELVDGEVVVTPSPSLRHQRILGRLFRALEAWREDVHAAVTVGLAPLDVRFGPGRILQPDLFVVLSELDESHSGPIDLVPELCVEIPSRDRVYDRVTKRLLYAEAGVREFWLVEPTGPVERYTGVGLRMCEVCDSSIETPLLPGFVLDIPAILGGAR